MTRSEPIHGRYIYDDDEFAFDETKHTRVNLIKKEIELFNDDSYVPLQMYNIKIKKKDKKNVWKFMINETIIFEIFEDEISEEKKKKMMSPESMKSMLDIFKREKESLTKQCLLSIL